MSELDNWVVSFGLRQIENLQSFKAGSSTNPHYVHPEEVGLARSTVVCLYHADCFDGTGAAWALTKRFPNATCIAVEYNKPVPLNQIPAGADVYLVDFCYQIDDLLLIAAVAKSMRIFDHHIGMKETVELFNSYMEDLGWSKTHYGVFDNNMSGAKLTWTQLMREHDVPLIIEHISDRDLWRFELEETKAVMAGLGTYPLDLKVWDNLFRWSVGYDACDYGSPHQAAVDALETDGHVALRSQQTDIRRLIASTKRSVELDGVDFPVVLINVPRNLASEALAQLAGENQGIALGYFDSEHERVFSIRTTLEGPEAMTLAKRYGGSGHARAAGFKVSRDHPLAQC